MSSETENGSNINELPIFIKWTDFMKWLLITVEKFPKKVRFTFSDRIINLTLDIVEDLIEARYSRQKVATLRRANLNLEKIRILWRICFELRVIPQKTYEHAIYSVNEVGKMIGGWLKQQEGK